MEKKYKRTVKRRNILGFGKIFQNTRAFSLDSENIKEHQEKE